MTQYAPGCGQLKVENGDFIRDILDRVGDKWTLLLIAGLNDGPVRYSGLQEMLPGISQRMLTLTLRRLQDDGLIARTSHPEVPPRVEYELTPLGRSLLDAASALVGWATEHHAELRASRAA